MGNTNITPVVPESDQGDIFSHIVSIIEEARSTVIRTVNTEMVIAYWCIGREIAEEQQAGRERALYGDNLLKKLSEKLTLKFGKGFSVTSLKYFRTCYITYKGRINRDQSEGHQQKIALSATFSTNLSWSHYRVLMRISNELRRTFYEIEAENLAAIVNFMAKYITKPFRYLENVVGVELNFNKIFYMPEKIREFVDILTVIDALDGELKELEAGLAL